MGELFKQPTVNGLVKLITAAPQPDFANAAGMSRARFRQELRRRRQHSLQPAEP
jgi:hypothetical protein